MTKINEALISAETRNFVQKWLKTMDVENHTMSVSEGSVRGDNYLGIIAKVVVTGEDKNGNNSTLDLIVKCAPKNVGFRMVSSARLLFGREIYMYSEVLPALVKFQKEKGIAQPFESFPKYYTSTMDDVNETVIMENMKELGYALRNRREPLDYNHVKLVMKEFGRLHALSYALRDQKPELFKEFADNTPHKIFETSVIAKKSVRDGITRALQSLDAVKDNEAYLKLKSIEDNFTAVLDKVLNNELAGKYSVLNHGDGWINNLLFKYESSDAPSQLCMLDWQLSFLGSPVLDLSYFIFTCTDRKLRELHYEDIIKEYYNSLSSFLRELGSDPEEMLPFGVLQEHLKEFSVFGLLISTLVLHLMMSEAHEIPDIQNAAKASDVRKNLGFQSRNEEKYLERVRESVLDFIKLDYNFV